MYEMALQQKLVEEFGDSIVVTTTNNRMKIRRVDHFNMLVVYLTEDGTFMMVLRSGNYIVVSDRLGYTDPVDAPTVDDVVREVRRLWDRWLDRDD